MSHRIVLLVNPAAGTLQRQGTDGFLDALVEAASWGEVEVREVEGDPGDAAGHALKSRPDLLAVAGGDGTARSAAAAAARLGADTPIVPLPLGTANLLPRRLYGERDARTVLREAQDYRAVSLHAGALETPDGAEFFFVAAGVGFPSYFAEAREAMRDGLSVGDAWLKATFAMRSMFRPRLRVRAGDDPTALKASGLMVFVGRAEQAAGAEAFKQEPAGLECLAADPRDIADAASLTLAALRRRWREHDRLAIARSPRVEVSGRSRLSVMLDGEPRMIEGPALFASAPDAVRALVPQES